MIQKHWYQHRLSITAPVFDQVVNSIKDTISKYGLGASGKIWIMYGVVSMIFRNYAANDAVPLLEFNRFPGA